MKAETGTLEWYKLVFDKNYDYIRNYLYYLSGDMELSEDLVQDTFVQLWEHRDRIKDETVKAYLFSVAKNAFLKTIRRNKYDLKFKSGYFEHVENQSPEYLMEMKEFDSKLQDTIASLPEKCRIIYLMNRIDELTYTQIAENLSVSVKAVEKQMSKALSILRNELGAKI